MRVVGRLLLAAATGVVVRLAGVLSALVFERLRYPGTRCSAR